MFDFEIKKKCGMARTAVLRTPHGEIKTPGFTPVATRGALRGLSFENARALGAEAFMMNTFHFYCNKEYEVVSKEGGLHNFLNIDSPIMTDSGGFQVFSLGAGWSQKTGKLSSGNLEKRKEKKGLVKIKEDRVVFRSPVDGSKVEITPETSVEAQQKLGADMIFAFDECTSPFASYNYHVQALERTHVWAKRSLRTLKNKDQVMFGIIQGGRFMDLRKDAAHFISSLPFFGFGIGGSFGESFGDSKKNMYSVLELLHEELPLKKPRHLLGIGEPDDIVESVFRGVDLFDCVIPTRFARHKTALTSGGRVNLNNSENREKREPIDKDCSCRICLNYKRSYLHHLLRKNEIYGIMLLAEHNLAFVLNLMKKIREAIEKDKLGEFRKSFIKNYSSKR